MSAFSLSRYSRLAALASMAACTTAGASVGIFGHGDGMQSMGMGGVSYSLAGEATALAGNPAHALSLGTRLDVGLEVLTPLARVNIVGNALGADSEHESSGKRFYAIPQGGFTLPLTERLSFGFSLLSAGLGPNYRNSPYARFNSAPNADILLASAGTISALAFQLTPEHAVGVGLNLGYQTLEVNGLQFLMQVSEQPDRVTDQGTDGSFSVGLTVGWVGRIAPDLTGGLGYRSKAWTQKHDDYAGLIPDAGRLELPAVFGGGVTYTGLPTLTLSAEAQRYLYEAERGFGNPVGKLADGNALGSTDGPSFGFKNQNVFKFGVAWEAHQQLTLRAGLVLASQMIRSSDTLFAGLGPASATDLYSLGSTFKADRWSLTSLLWYNPRDGVQGRGSIPEAFGGGEANTSNELLGFGLSFGWEFGS